MRGCLMVLGLLLPLAISAAEWSPYVGVGGQVGSAFTDVWHVKDENSESEVPYTGFGSEFEAGVTGGWISVYGGYTLFGAQGGRDKYTWTSRAWFENSVYETRALHRYGWTDRRWMAGVRMLLNPHGRTLVQPVVGLTMTCGRMRNSEDITETVITRDAGTFAPVQTTSYHHNSSNWTNWQLGWKAEMGFLIRTGTPVDLWLLAQAHVIQSEFTAPMYDTDYVEPRREWILVPTLQFSARYVIPGLTAGGGSR